MHLRTLGYALAAGVATFLVVFVAVSELLVPTIEFSVLVGIPAGLIAGVAAIAGVLLGLGERSRGPTRSLAVALGTFGLVLLVALVGALLLLKVSLTLSLVGGTVLGVLGALAAFLWHRREARTPVGAEQAQ